MVYQCSNRKKEWAVSCRSRRADKKAQPRHNRPITAFIALITVPTHVTTVTRSTSPFLDFESIALTPNPPTLPPSCLRICPQRGATPKSSTRYAIDAAPCPVQTCRAIAIPPYLHPVQGPEPANALSRSNYSGTSLPVASGLGFTWLACTRSWPTVSTSTSTVSVSNGTFPFRGPRAPLPSFAPDRDPDSAIAIEPEYYLIFG